MIFHIFLAISKNKKINQVLKIDFSHLLFNVKENQARLKSPMLLHSGHSIQTSNTLMARPVDPKFCLRSMRVNLPGFSPLVKVCVNITKFQKLTRNVYGPDLRAFRMHANVSFVRTPVPIEFLDESKPMPLISVGQAHVLG